MLEMLFQNLKLMAILATIFVLSFGTNTLLGSIDALIRPDRLFDKEKCLMGLKKGLLLFLGSLVITILVSLLPALLSLYNIDSSYIEDMSLIGMAVPILTASMNYLRDAIAKLFSLLNINATTFVETKPSMDPSVKGE